MTRRPRLVNFTRGEGRALGFFLRHSPEAIYAMLPNAERWPPLWVTARRHDLATTLALTSPFVVLCGEEHAERRALDLAILTACVEHCDFHRARPWTRDGRENAQAYNGAVRCLWNARAKIAAAFGLEPDAIPFPQV